MGFVREYWRELFYIIFIVAAAFYFHGFKGLSDLFDGIILFIVVIVTISVMFFKRELIFSILKTVYYWIFPCNKRRN